MDIPGFKVKETIGRGGMATVYLAVQESLGREVVLKLLNAESAEREDFVTRFLNEGRIIASLRHPHIITIYDIGQAGDMVYIAMEYVEGGDLKNRLARPMATNEALDILYAIASALATAHAKGIVHRDVKPANILFRADGTPLLSDFGIAKQLSVDIELTSTGTILGSPFYMSPEQSEGQEIDGRTDIYSLGVIAFEMFTGERPYLGDSAIKVILQHIQSPVPRLPQGLQRLQPLVDEMMAKNREQRIQTATALLRRIDEVRRAERDPLVLTASQLAPTRHRKQRRARQRLAVLLACMLMLGAGFGAFYAWTETLSTSTVIRALPGAALINESGVVPPNATIEPTLPSVPAATPADTPPALREDVTKALEWLARHSLEQNRLTQPPADNAYYYYSRLLAMDPGNETARRGFAQIAERFVTLAENEFSKGNYGKAQAYIALGLQVQPQNEALLTLQSFIDDRNKGMLDTLMDFFRSE